MNNSKISEKEKQNISNIIQENQLPSDKYLLHLNKRFSKVQSNRNAEIIYNTGEPMRLNKGDKATLYKSFLNVRGQDQQTITLEKDFEHELLFVHYIPYDNVSNTGTGYATDKIFGMQRMSEYTQVPTEQNFELNYVKANLTTTFSASNLDMEYTPPFGAPAIMGVALKYTENPNNPPIDDMPTVQMLEFTTKTITVKAGNYTVEALANNIQNQLNGANFNNDEFQNLIFNNSQNPDSDYNNAVDGKITKKLNVPDRNSMGFSDINYIAESLRPQEIEPSPNEPIDVSNITNKVFWDLASVSRLKGRLNQFIIDDVNNTFATDKNKGKFGVNNIEYPIEYLDDARKSRDSTKIYDSCLIPHQITRNFKNPDSNNSLNLEKFQSFDGNSDFFGGLPDNAIAQVDYRRNWRAIEGDGADSFQITEINFGGGSTASRNMAPIQGVANPGTTSVNTIDNATAEMITSKRENDRIIGPNNINFTFGNNQINRFSFSDFHTSKKIPSYQYGIGQNNVPADPVSTGTNAGSQCTQMNVVSSLDNYGFSKYPIEATSGIMILSFDNGAKKATKKYKEILSKLQSTPTNDLQRRIAYQQALNIFEHDYYFENETEAIDSWRETLWFRLGFSYEQLGNIGDRREEYYTFYSQLQHNILKQTPEKVKTLGLMTHNEADFVFSSSMNMLGASIIPKSQTGVYQTFDTLNYIIGSDVSQKLEPVVVAQTDDPRRGSCRAGSRQPTVGPSEPPPPRL